MLGLQIDGHCMAGSSISCERQFTPESKTLRLHRNDRVFQLTAYLALTRIDAYTVCLGAKLRKTSLPALARKSKAMGRK